MGMLYFYLICLNLNDSFELGCFVRGCLDELIRLAYEIV